MGDKLALCFVFRPFLTPEEDWCGVKLYATDGICTHEKTHLAEGLIVGKMIECPKHNGRFNLEGGSPARKPGCKAFKTHEVKECDGRVFFRIGD